MIQCVLSRWEAHNITYISFNIFTRTQFVSSGMEFLCQSFDLSQILSQSHGDLSQNLGLSTFKNPNAVFYTAMLRELNTAFSGHGPTV